MILQPVFFPFFPVLHCPLGLAELQACPFPDDVFPPHPLLPCPLPPFTVPCKMVLARPDEWETWPYHCSLRLFPIVRRSSCGPIACWILAWTSLLVIWSLYEMCSIQWQHPTSMVCILPCSSAVKVHDSQAYRKMDVTRERISRILDWLELREILQSFQTGFSLVNLSHLPLIHPHPTQPPYASLHSPTPNPSTMLGSSSTHTHLYYLSLYPHTHFPLLLLRRTSC